MGNWFIQNMDYAYFFDGAAFFFLGIFCFALCVRVKEKKWAASPWAWMGLFGFIHGLREWLEMLAYELSSPGLLAIERDFFLAGAFFCLFEFVRRMANHCTGRKIRLWVSVLWLGLVLTGFFFWQSHSVRDAGVRYFLGFPVTVLVSFVFWSRSVRKKLAWSPHLLTSLSVLFLLYAFFGVLIGSRSSLGMSRFLNEESFLYALAFPVPAVRGLVVTCLSFLFVFQVMGILSGWRRQGVFLSGLFVSFVCFYFVFLYSGVRFVDAAGVYEKIHLQRLVLSDIRLLANALEDVGLDVLGSPQNAIYPSLRKAHQRMAALADIGPYAKSLYFVIFNRGHPEFLVGSQSQIFPYRTMPLFARSVPEEVIRDAFYAKHEVIVGPYADLRGGQVFSVFVPLHGPDKIGLGLLGADLDSAKVFSQIARVRLYAIFVVMAFLILLVGGYGFLIVFALKNYELEIQKNNLDIAVRNLREAEAELARSEETFRGILNNSPNAIFGFDRDLRLIFWNHGAERLYGFAKEDVIDEKDPLMSQRFVTLLGMEEGADDAGAIFGGSTWMREMSQRVKGGSEVHVLMTAFPVKDPQGRILFGMGLAQDISAHKAAEEMLAGANAQLRSVLDGSTHLAIVASDLDGKVAVVNKGVEKILGFVAGELIGHSLVQFFPAMNNVGLATGEGGVKLDGFKSILAFVGQGNKIEGDWTVARKDGGQAHLEVTLSGQFDSAGLLEGVILIGIDRSARREAERALRESEQRYRDLVNNLKVGVYLSSPGPEGRFLEVNPAMLDIFEADTADQLLQIPISNLYRSPHMRKDFTEQLLREGVLKNEEKEMVTLKGRYFTASVTATVRKKDSGEEFFCGTIQDVTDQKRLEASLKEERDRLRKIATHIGAGLVLFDRNYSILWVNEVMEQWFGKLNTIQGKKCFDVFRHRTSLCDECATAMAIKTGVTHSIEMRVVLPCGKEMDFAMISSPIKNERGDVDQVLELVLDFTDRHRILELLEYERALSRNVIDSIGDPLLVFDAQKMVVLDANRVFLEETGLKKKDVVGKFCDTVQASPSILCNLEEFHQVLKTGRRKEVTHIVEKGDGKKIFLDVSLTPLKDERGQVIGLIHIVHDVSGRKRLEDDLKNYSESLEALVKERTQALEASELMFRRLFESAQDGILIIDLDSGNIIDANTTLLELLSCDRNEVKEKDYRQVACFADAPQFDQAIEEVKRSKVAFFDDVSLKSSDGQELSVELRASLYFVENRRVAQCNIRDITERKKLERIKSEFVSMVSHELRTPLSAIKEGVEIVADGTQGKLNRDQTECLNIALSNIRRLNRLIGDILDISKIQSNLLKIEISPCNVTEVVDQVYGLVKIEIEKRGLVLVTNIEKDLPFVMADKDRLIQVLMNLLNNAVKFTRDNSKISLMCRRVKEGIEFAVADQGPGISADEISRLFGRFVQLDSTLVRRVGGTGLGLYISKNLLGAMGGTIWAESTVGEGTIFRFLLPAQKERS